MGDPFRDRRLSSAEVRRILKRAADLAEQDPEAQERTFSTDEVERAAGDLGLPPAAVARAIAGPSEEGASGPERKASWFFGAPTRLALEEDFAGELSESDQEDVIEDIRDELGDAGSVERVGKTLLWRVAPTPGRSGSRDISVRVRSRDGRTRVVLEERLMPAAVGLFVGMGAGLGIGPLGGYIALIAKVGAIGLLLPLLWIPAVLLVARLFFVALASRRQARMKALMVRLRKRSTGWTAHDAAAPLRAPEARPRVREGEELERDAELEAPGVGSQRRA